MSKETEAEVFERRSDMFDQSANNAIEAMNLLSEKDMNNEALLIEVGGRMVRITDDLNALAAWVRAFVKPRMN